MEFFGDVLPKKIHCNICGKEIEGGVCFVFFGVRGIPQKCTLLVDEECAKKIEDKAGEFYEEKQTTEVPGVGRMNIFGKDDTPYTGKHRKDEAVKPYNPRKDEPYLGKGR